MITEITGYIRERGAVTLAELALHFDTDAAALEGMLQLLERKGRVAREESPCARCKGCAQIKPEDAVFYRATN